MTLTTINRTSPKFLLSTLSAVVIAASLSGCLSSGGSSDDDDPAQPVNPLQLSTEQGDYIGISENGMRVYRGIRYGEAERFAAPAFPAAHSAPVQLSTEFGSDCPQNASAFGNASVNEDCLFLNVYAPEEPGEYPVMVWIHGGAFIYGSGGESYEPARLVDKGVVVVTLNYRLGALGFLPHGSLGDSNFGLQDQQLALQWVKENIGAFDGDADNVTIFGESAGGHSVMSQLASPAAEGLFHKAIVQSGSYNGDQVSLPVGQALFGNPTVAATECADDTGDQLVSCLQSLSVEEILEAQPGNILPVTGTAVLPISINQALTTGEFNQVPVVMGSNRDEGALFTLLALGEGKDLSSAPGYDAAVVELLSEDPRIDAKQIADEYLAKQPPTPLAFINAYTAIGTDWRFNCPNDAQWELLQGQVDTWGYWFNDRNAPNALGIDAPFPLGAAHSFEIQYVLSSEETLTERGAGPDQLALAEYMAQYWTNFAKYGDDPAIGPNGTDGAAEAVEWPRLTTNGNILRLDAPTPVAVARSEFSATHRCEIWNPTQPQ